MSVRAMCSGVVESSVSRDQTNLKRGWQDNGIYPTCRIIIRHGEGSRGAQVVEGGGGEEGWQEKESRVQRGGDDVRAIVYTALSAMKRSARQKTASRLRRSRELCIAAFVHRRQSIATIRRDYVRPRGVNKSRDTSRSRRSPPRLLTTTRKMMNEEGLASHT